MEDKDLYSVFIAEDEQPARDLLAGYILKREELHLSGWSKNGKEALENLNENAYDLLFLDINLPLMNGIEIIEKLKNPPYVIFTTAYNKYAVKAFEIGAVDYLLKPFSEKRFNTAVDKALDIIKNKSAQNYPTMHGLYFKKKDGGHYLVPFNEILYISSMGRNSCVYTKTGIHQTLLSLKDIIGKLPAKDFIRIHKQYVVNVKYISHVQYLMGGQYILFIKNLDNTYLPIGRIYTNELKGKLFF